MRDQFRSIQIRIMSALHKMEFRHMVHLAIYVDSAQPAVWRAMKDLEARGFVKTWKERPDDADRKYKFTKIKLTRKGLKLARLCSELCEAINEWEPPSQEE